MSDHIADAGKMVHAAKLADALEEHPKGAAMTNDAQRIAMAELEGWIYPGSTCLKHESWNRWIRPAGETSRKVPDYASDLNAVRRVEEKLTDEEFERYRMELSDSVRKEKGAWRVDWRSIVSASAAQKTESILRATGKWTP